MTDGETLLTSRRKRMATRRPVAVSLLIGACAIWMGLVGLAAASSDQVGLNSVRRAHVQADCEVAPASDGTTNWGAVATPVGGEACHPEIDVSDAAWENWGRVPPSDVVIRISLDGQNVVQLPEVVGQPAGEIGAGSGQPCQTGAAGLDPKWTEVTRWDAAIQSATQLVYQETGVQVPTNVVRSIVMIESGGDPNAGPAYGLMQVTAGAIGKYDLARTQSDPAYGIYAGSKELALRYLDSKKLPWENVIVGYFSGHYIPNGAKDDFNSDFQYQDRFKQLFTELEAVAPGDRACTTTAAGGLSSIWGNMLFNGGPPPTSQDFGPTDFSRFVHPEWYTYALEYGFTEPGHTGLDVAIPAGTPLYAPMDSTVICAGTGNGNGEDSCAAFLSSYGGATSGRLQLKLPNGDMLILGHVNESLVRPGDQVKAGQEVGISGGMNGDHVHVEYRTRDATTGSGWRLLNPHGPLDGVAITVTPGPARTVTPMTQPTPTTEPTAPSASPEAIPDASPEASPDASPDASPEVSSEVDVDVGLVEVAIATPIPASPEASPIASPMALPEDDLDLDGLTVEQETTAGTKPDNPDSDGDGLLDGDEVLVYLTNPLNGDTDGDGLPDFNEVMQYGTNPSNPDSDGDGFNDFNEINAGTNPNDSASFTGSPNAVAVDSDGDGLTDAQEAELQTDPNNADSDFDGYGDYEEASVGSNPNDPASFPGNTAVDSDGDGIPDDDEADYGTDASNADTDLDGLSDGQEVQTYFTNPLSIDTDGDGADDAFEVSSGTNPNDSGSFP